MARRQMQNWFSLLFPPLCRRSGSNGCLLWFSRSAASLHDFTLGFGACGILVDRNLIQKSLQRKRFFGAQVVAVRGSGLPLKTRMAQECGKRLVPVSRVSMAQVRSQAAAA